MTCLRRGWSGGRTRSPIAMNQNPQTAFWNTLRSPSGPSEGVCCAWACRLGSGAGNRPWRGWPRTSAVSSAFAVADRRSVYQRARGATASLASSAAAIDSIFLSRGLAKEVGSQPTVAASPDRQQRHAKIGIEVAAGTGFDQRQPAVSQESLPGGGDFVVGSTCGRRASPGARAALPAIAGARGSWRPGRDRLSSATHTGSRPRRRSGPG